MSERRLRKLVVAGAALLGTTLLAGGCSDEEKPELLVEGTEMAFDAPATIEAGTYELRFKNVGQEHHEVAVRDASGEVLGRVSAGPGAERSFEIDLSAGRYELGCFEPGHYEGGMHQPLTVT